MILNISGLSKSYADKTILKDISFHMDDKEKAAIVGINGSGKTTLIKCVLGEEEPDDGIITIAKGKKIGYLSQQHADADHKGDAYDVLSGGQKTRQRLEEILAGQPDLLILDEPTNHLDIFSIQWLEKVLKYYRGAVLLVSHDRYFLDKVVSKIIDLDGGKARTYLGNYTVYAEKKRLIRDAERKAWMKQQDEIRHQQAVIEKLRQFNREKSIRRAESREKMLDKMELLEKPQDIENEMRLALTPNILSGKDVLSVRELSKSFGAKVLFSHVSFDIRRGEHIAVIGANGTGKTTLLKILNSLETADGGEFTLGSKVHIGYYDQEHAVLHMEKTIFEEIQDDYPHLDHTKIRSVLASFLFTGDDVYKKIGDLSGGEQGRVSLAKLMLSDSNFLILDEPTNHLDIQSKEVLEDALQNYEGTVLYVSHDRYFINKTADRILELYEYRFDNYIGNYDYYLEKRDDVRKYGVSIQEKASGPSPTSEQKRGWMPQKESASDASPATEQKRDWMLQKELKAGFRKLENDLKRTESEIQQLEATLSALDEKLQDPAIASDSARLLAVHKEREETDSRLASLYEHWENVSEQLENYSDAQQP